MSDGSSVLLNMGSEVATANGFNPAATSKPVASEGQNGDFAAVLKSALVPKASKTLDSTVEKLPLTMDAQLLMNMADTGESEISLENLNAELLLDGKVLPSDEQKLAWQNILAEYDSADPDSPRMVIATGDENGYEVEQISPEDLNKIIVGMDKANGTQGETPADDNPQHESQFSAEHITDLNADREETDGSAETTAPAFSMMAEKPQHNQTPGMKSDSDGVNGISKLQNLESGRPVEHMQNNDQASQGDIEHAASEQDMEGLQHLKQETHKDAQFKSELNNAIENANMKLAQASGVGSNNSNVNSANNSGAMAYSAISGLSNAMTQPQPALPVVANMTISPQNPAWGDIVGDKVHWMVAQNISEAKIRLNPPELGMLEVRVTVGHDQSTSISFSSPHSQVRDALETAVPRLREMFNENGLSLGNVDVSHHSMSGREQAGQDQNTPASPGGFKEDDRTGGVAMEGPIQRHTTGVGMLDLYA